MPDRDYPPQPGALAPPDDVLDDDCIPATRRDPLAVERLRALLEEREAATARYRALKERLLRRR